MPIHGYPGNIITANPTTPSVSSASGVWTTEQQLQYQTAGNWPMAATQISRSLRFNSADSAYLNRTPASATNRKTWTWSGWVKRSNLGSTQYIFAGGQTTSVRFESDDTINFYSFSSAYDARINTSQVFRDVGAWYHIVAVFDTGSATTTLTGSSTDRMRLYVNGTQVSNFSATVVPTQNFQGYINNNEPHMLNARYNGSYVDTNGNWYLTEVNFIDGQALTPASFGFTDPATGIWGPRQYTGPYGTNGFYLNFSDNSGTTSTTLGKDYSGNGNNWTPNNFSVTAGSGNDSLVDTPTPYGTDTGAGGEVRGNYCTSNAIYKGGDSVLTNGNLNVRAGDSLTSYSCDRGTIAVSSGKWYYEFVQTNIYSTDPPNRAVGWGLTSMLNTTYPGGTGSYSYVFDGSKYVSTVNSAYGASWTTNDVIGLALDLDAGTLVCYKNGVSQGTLASGLSGTFTPIYGRIGNDAGRWIEYVLNFGQRPFAYTAPSGFKALCTQNLPTPTIGATSTTQANDYFNTVLYTGDGSNPRGITGVGFQPDFVWLKNRSAGWGHRLSNAVVGANYALESNNTNAELFQNQYGYLTSFNSDGFTVTAGSTDDYYTNNSGDNYVAWNWKANGAGSSNTAGTISSTVSANTTAGFSIATWTHNGSTGTVGHGLGVAPKMIIAKTRNGANDWFVYTEARGATKTLYLNLTNAEGTTSAVWNNTAPTSTVFTASTTFSTNTCVAYCFSAVAGYSAFGSYVGNGNSDGTFVYTGFKPALIILKVYDGTASWLIHDNKRNTYNVVDKKLFPNLSDAEATADVADFLSNGFKLRGTNTQFNGSGYNYIYAAFAESPFKYSLAR